MGRGTWHATVHGIARVGHNLATKLPPPKSLYELAFTHIPNPQDYLLPKWDHLEVHITKKTEWKSVSESTLKVITRCKPPVSSLLGGLCFSENISYVCSWSCWPFPFWKILNYILYLVSFIISICKLNSLCRVYIYVYACMIPSKNSWNPPILHYYTWCYTLFFHLFLLVGR